MRNFLFSVYRLTRNLLSDSPLREILHVKPVKNFLWRKLRPNYTEIDGRKMFLDPHDSMLLSLKGVYEPYATSVIKKIVKKGDVVLDIGANIGYYTLMFARLVGEEGRVYAFEPHPETFALLKKNVEINGFGNIEVARKAVSDKNEQVNLYLFGQALYHSTVNIHGNADCIPVDAVRLDDYFKDFNGKIDLIKIDIEGGEPRALEGMKSLLRNTRNVKLITEYAPTALEGPDAKLREYLETLIELGFKFYHMNEKQKKTTPATVDELEGIYANILCIRES